MKTLSLKPVDAVWLMMETEDTPLHLGVLAIFRKPAKAAKDYLAKLAESLRDHPASCAPWNYRLAGEGVAGALPSLREVRDVDLNHHFQRSALPTPGGERELGEVVSRLHSATLDKNRPLWEFHLIEGLERDRFAFYLKIHHAVVGDINALPLVFDLLSASARSRNPLPPWARPLPSPEQGDEAAGSVRLGESLASLGRAGAGMLRAALTPGVARSVLLPSGAPTSTLNRRINQQRRFATQQFEQARIERLAEATSSTVNELLTYLCGTSLRRFFKEYNALPEQSLVGLIPISLRERDSRLPGNAIAGIRVELGTQFADPMDRLAAVKQSIQSVREDRQSLPGEVVTPYVLLRAAPLVAAQLPGIGRLVPPVFNLGVSNSTGPDAPRYFDGARLDAIYTLNHLMQHSALSIDCVSYAGTLNIGFTGARDTLPHLQRLAVYLGRAMTELEQIVEDREAA